MKNVSIVIRFLLSCWKYSKAFLSCSFPTCCETCDAQFSTFHIVYECKMFEGLREAFRLRTGRHWNSSRLNEFEIRDDVCFFFSSLVDNILMNFSSD